MGVPVVTCPQSRVVSRQTFALLSAIGLRELAAKDADDRARLSELRGSLRERMRSSPLCDVAGFARDLEAALIGLHREIQSGVHSAA